MMRRQFIKIFYLVLISIFMVGCLPETAPIRDQAPKTQTENNENPVPGNNSESPIRELPQTSNFIQLGTQESIGTTNVFADYKDSFLIRGNNIISHLSEVVKVSQSNFCLTAKFSAATVKSPTDTVILSAKVRSYFSPILNTREYFLQIEPNNKVLNQVDCSNPSLLSNVQTDLTSNGIAQSLIELCPNCTSNLSSSGLKLFSASGNFISELKTSSLFLNIIPAAGTTTQQPTSCQSNSACTPKGFNCCLSGQCVNHGEKRPEVSSASNKYIEALKIIGSRPELINNFADVFYICPEMVPEDTDVVDNTNPGQIATDLLTELNDLYNCLNPIVDEISVCRKDFVNATELMRTSSATFESAKDDLTFKTFNTLITGNNIVEIRYGGKTFYKEALTPNQTPVALDPANGTLSISNDNLTARQTAQLQIPKPTAATTDTLSLYYKIDGTCEKLGSSLARCRKSYTQGQVSTPARSSDHPSGNNSFRIPSYFDPSFNIIVEVGGSPVPQGSDTWVLSGANIQFNSSEFPIYDNQQVKITYFVSNNVSELTSSRSAAQQAVDAHCTCDPNEKACSLKPVKTDVNGEQKITSYACIYPTPEGEDIPLQETVYVSAKTVPHKFYDASGVHYEAGTIGSGFEQEGELFEYTSGDTFKPNNITKDIGFNEIYGSMNNGGTSPRPPTVITVEAGKNYDIFVDEGAFSTCLNCGTDYYSSMQKVFPNNFENKGAGYLPDFVESRKRQNRSAYSADDFKFGRACFVPATMLPWTHVANADVKTQRRNRLSAQHFMFANGMNKDWYGFDYGSVIGSFDGVRWFAIGSQRRIKATTKKLYIAVNAYFGDLTIDNSFKVTVTEELAIPNSGSNVLSDLASDGALCQKAHLCETDNDCLTQLGYEYTCANVSSFLTPWPQFDANANEISGSITRGLASLIGGTNGEARRCVYRGRGAACEQNSSHVNAASSYTNSNSTELHHCSPNTTCTLLTSAQFNTKIARFAESPKSQNIKSFITNKSDVFGLGARNLGRPYEFYGKTQPAGNVRAQLQANNVKAMCIPGKSPEVANTLEESNKFKSINATADKISNVGKTFPSTVLQDPNYLATCPAIDDSGNYTAYLDKALDDPAHAIFAIRDNISSNSLLLSNFDKLNLFNDDESPIVNMGIHKNTCLRAPGASCFSDFECAPNNFISQKVNSLTTINGEVNEAEFKFWKEELTCGGPQDRYIVNGQFKNPEYDLTQNRCCRETAKDFTYSTQKHEGSPFKVVDASGNPLIPGINQDLNDPERYSRTHTIYDKLISQPTKYPSLVSAASQPSVAMILSGQTIRQYNTLHLNNSRMCCTGNWVRNFATGSFGNGGGHKFLPGKTQNISIETFKPLSWSANNVPAINSFGGIPYDPTLQTYTCTPEDHLTADCEVKNILAGSLEEKKYLNWFGKLELLGIPQVLIETNNDVFKPLATEPMDLNNDSVDEIFPQDDISSARLPLDNTIKDVAVDGAVDAIYNGKGYYSAASNENFKLGGSNLKRVFSEDSFNCCLPTGVTVPDTTTSSQCCTGQFTNQGGAPRCCMNDFTNLSVYTNRYVSSEGASFEGNNTSDSDVEPTSGYIKKEIVLKMAETMCCSGKATYGTVLDQYFIPIEYDKTFNDTRTRRWMYNQTLDNSPSPTTGINRVDLYNAGVRWNDHVYCIPEELANQIEGATN